MSDTERKVQVVTLLDDIAADSVAASESELREQLVDAGVDPDNELRKIKMVSQSAIKALRKYRIDLLPDAVPEDPVEVRSLLDQLLAMPNAPSEAFTLAFRENTGTSERDIRLLTKHLLELLKKQHGT